MNTPINAHEQQSRDMMKCPELQFCCDMIITGTGVSITKRCEFYDFPWGYFGIMQ
jgi:hypothetical protein